MSYPEPFDAPDRVIVHEALAQKINAIPHMCWNYHVSHLLLAQDSTREGRFDENLVAFVDAVLRDFPLSPCVSIILTKY